MKKFILAAFLILGLLASGCGGAPTEKKRMKNSQWLSVSMR